MNRFGVQLEVLLRGSGRAEQERAIELAGTLGYRVLELAPVGSAELTPTRRLLERARLEPVVALALGPASDISSGDPGQVARGEALLTQALATARDLGAQRLTGVLYSAVGKYPTPPSEAGRWNCISVLARLAEKAAKSRITVGIAPANRYETNLVNTVAQALDLIAEIGADNLAVHLNSFHMQIEETSPAAAIERAGARLDYLQLAESHRGHLGSGTVDLAALFAALTRIDYQGPVTFEALASGATDADRNVELAIWRPMWSDGRALADHARRFMAAQAMAARRRVA